MGLSWVLNKQMRSGFLVVVSFQPMRNGCRWPSVAERAVGKTCIVRGRTVAAETLASKVRCTTFGAPEMTSDEGEIKAKREAAARARRLLNEFVRADDRERVLRFVAELEARADALERS